MTTLVVFLILFAVLGIASALGWTVDSRDPDYTLGAVLEPRSAALDG